MLLSKRILDTPFSRYNNDKSCIDALMLCCILKMINKKNSLSFFNRDIVFEVFSHLSLRALAEPTQDHRPRSSFQDPRTRQSGQRKEINSPFYSLTTPSIMSNDNLHTLYTAAFNVVLMSTTFPSTLVSFSNILSCGLRLSGGIDLYKTIPLLFAIQQV